jgi:hypothetical protein
MLPSLLPRKLHALQRTPPSLRIITRNRQYCPM